MKDQRCAMPGSVVGERADGCVCNRIDAARYLENIIADRRQRVARRAVVAAAKPVEKSF